ncbi:hypothetical protein WICPIJ_009058 [Wickerhamomyces pijperi]|uniref:NAD(P)-binding protein n=1 Tax=Wickerhamomyces pijperi TaxID=599730 RepID=A0A9P8PS03_WICPI|nr:hypothetical protein WICPIJ_009058 [Wickerhamomyces pijperi]
MSTPTRKKVVFITGASSGIGFSLAVEFAKQPDKYKVYAGARSLSKMDPLKDLGVNTVAFDITSSESITKVRDLIKVENDGNLDILYNNAGVSIHSSIFDLSQDQLKRTFQVNVFGVVETIQSFQLLLLKAQGTVVFTSSIADHLPMPFLFAYTGSKIAFTNIAKTLAGEVKDLGVKVLVVRTGSVASEMTDNMNGDARPYPSKDSIYYLPDRNIYPSLEDQKLTPALEYSKQVVKDVENFMAGSSFYKEIYRGEGATIAWFVSLWAPTSFIVGVLFPKIFKFGDVFSRVKENIKRVLDL